MATLNYNNAKVNKLYYQNTEVKKCYYHNVLVHSSMPSLIEILKTATVKFISGRNSSSKGAVTLNPTTMGSRDYVLSFCNGHVGIHKTELDSDGDWVITTLYRTSSTYGGLKSNNSLLVYNETGSSVVSSTVYGATLVYLRFDNTYDIDTINTVLSTGIPMTQHAGHNSSTRSLDSLVVEHNGSVVLTAYSDYFSITVDGVDIVTATNIPAKVVGSNSTTYYASSNTSTTRYGGSIIALKDGPIQPPSSHTPGDIITWDNKDWLVCHYDSSTNRVYLISKDIISKTEFGSNNIYARSTLASVAATYQSNNMSAAALEMCVDVTVNGVTAKVFVPSKEQFNGGFSWFSSDTKRIAQYQGSNTTYWTSSPVGSRSVLYIMSTGRLNDDVGSPSNSHGFRPCVCVQL